MVDSVIMGESVDSKMEAQSQSGLFPNLAPAEGVELKDSRSNFYRDRIQRDSLSNLLKEAESGPEMRSAKNLKQLKYLTNMYRQKIYKIGDSLNVGVPKSIR